MSPFVSIPTSGYSAQQLAALKNRTFQGYAFPVNHTPEAFLAFSKHYQLDLERSVMLVDAECGPVALAMLGVRGQAGWCGGFGVVPEFRGRGLSHELMNSLVRSARAAGLTTLSLEVMVQNTAAIRVYERAGLVLIRSVHGLRIGVQEIKADSTRSRAESLPVYSVISDPQFSQVASQAVWQRHPSSLASRQDLFALRTGDSHLLYSASERSPEIRIEWMELMIAQDAEDLIAAALVETRRRGWQPTTVALYNEPETTPLYALCVHLGFRTLFSQNEMKICFEPVD